MVVFHHDICIPFLAMIFNEMISIDPGHTIPDDYSYLTTVPDVALVSVSQYHF